MNKLMHTKNKPAGTRLTVIIRDDSPLINCSDMPSYRRVTITLTGEQIKKMMLEPTCQQGERVFHESVSKCFLEE